MNKERILIRVYRSNQIEYIADDLIHANIEHKIKFLRNEISTKNLIIKLIVIPFGVNEMDRVKGMRAIGCHGFNTETTDYLTKGNNVCKDYDLIEYIKEIDEMGF